MLHSINYWEEYYVKHSFVLNKIAQNPNHRKIWSLLFAEQSYLFPLFPLLLIYLFFVVSN